MKEIVTNKLTTTSLIVADHFGKIHRDVIRAIENLGCSDEFSLRNFAHSDFTNSRGKTYRGYTITRDGFAMLAMGFTGKKAMEWKEKFISAFNEMERRLLQAEANNDDPQWITQRKQSKLGRRLETDVIQQFVDYATGQGSENAKFYYKHITNASYKALGLIQHKQPKLRDTLDWMELSWLTSAEWVAKQSILKHMAAKEHYKTIFVLVRQDIERFADGLMIPKKHIEKPQS